MSFNNAVSSTEKQGFRLSGYRMGNVIVPLDPGQKTMETFKSVLQRSAPDPSDRAKLAELVKKLVVDLEQSTFFMKHNLYDSSLLIVFDNDPNDGIIKAVAKIIDIRDFVERDGDVSHRVDLAELPLPIDTPRDGYLTALENLATALES